MNQKGFVGVLITIVIVLSFLGGYLLKNNYFKDANQKLENNQEINNNNQNQEKKETVSVDDEIIEEKNEQKQEEQTKQEFNQEQKTTYGPYQYLSYIYFSKDGHFFVYTSGGFDYVNVNEKIYGPYDKIYKLRVDNINFGFIYEKNGKTYANINGKDYGPYQYGDDFYYQLFDISGSNFGIIYQNDDGKSYVNVNEKIYGPNKRIKCVEVNEDSFGFIYSDDSNNEYININNKIYGPYKSVNCHSPLSEKNDNLFISNNLSIFSYKGLNENETTSTNVNGKVYKNTGEGFIVSPNGKSYGFTYMKDEDIQKIIQESNKNPNILELSFNLYFNFNGKEYGPYQYLLGPISESDTTDPFSVFDGVFLLKQIYKESGQVYKKVIINGQSYGPYQNIALNRVFLLGDAKGNSYIYEYMDNNKVYTNINNNIYSFNDNKGFSMAVIDGNNYIILDDDQENLIINGEKFGPYEIVWNPGIDEKGKWGFVFADQDGNIYLNLNGKIEDMKLNVDFNHDCFIINTIEDNNGDYYYVAKVKKENGYYINLIKNNNK